MGRAYEVRKASIQKTGAAKGKIYTTFAKEIYLAAKNGSPNPDANVNLKRLIDKAILAMNNSYSPYSNFKVGAAILLNNGEYILGTNIENKSYSLTICAEKCALSKLVSDGYKKDDIVAMCVVGNTVDPITPCGGCREFMSELLNSNTSIVLANTKRDRMVVNVSDLLPLSFKLEK